MAPYSSLTVCWKVATRSLINVQWSYYFFSYLTSSTTNSGAFSWIPRSEFDFPIQNGYFVEVVYYASSNERISNISAVFSFGDLCTRDSVLCLNSGVCQYGLCLCSSPYFGPLCEFKTPFCNIANCNGFECNDQTGLEFSLFFSSFCFSFFVVGGDVVLLLFSCTVVSQVRFRFGIKYAYAMQSLKDILHFALWGRGWTGPSVNCCFVLL